MKKPALRIGRAYRFYRREIRRERLFQRLVSLGLPVAGSIHPRVWEAFGAVLTGARATGGYGADLKGWEVKSAVEGGSFEYQYHRNGGLAKLEEDAIIEHLFVSYSRDYRTVTVRVVHGKDLSDHFKSWRTAYLANYARTEQGGIVEGGEPRQRFRKSIPFGAIGMRGRIVMQIQDGKLVALEDLEGQAPANAPTPKPRLARIRRRQTQRGNR